MKLGKIKYIISVCTKPLIFFLSNTHTSLKKKVFYKADYHIVNIIVNIGDKMGEHPHNRAIANMNSVSSLIRILNESREAFIRKNLSIHLHPKELTLIKQIQKHIKPPHKQVRINRYKKLQENPDEIPTHYELHLKLYLARYKKLEKKGLITVE